MAESEIERLSPNFQGLLSWLLRKWTFSSENNLLTFQLNAPGGKRGTNVAIYGHALLRIHVIGSQRSVSSSLQRSRNQRVLVLHHSWSVMSRIGPHVPDITPIQKLGNVRGTWPHMRHACKNSFSYSQIQFCVSDRARTRQYCQIQLRSWAPPPKLVGFGVLVRMRIVM